IELFSDVGLLQGNAQAKAREKGLAAFQRAFDQGCADPLVQSLYFILSGKNLGGPGGYAAHGKPNFRDASEEVLTRNYPPAIKLLIDPAYLRYIKPVASPN